MTKVTAMPFGYDIQADDVVKTMSEFNSWEDRYRQVILWGKALPQMDDSLKIDNLKVSGCESQVWLSLEQDNGIWVLSGDSDARIVKGLIAIVFAALNNKTSEYIKAFDIDDYFNNIGLLNHLSPSRGNGLKAIVNQIKSQI